MRSIIVASLSVLALIGCEKKPPAGDQMSAAEQASKTEQPAATTGGGITDRDWVLIALGEQTSPLGAGNEPATLRLEAANSTAVGFAGCNRYRSTFTLSGDSLRFGPAMSTKMACADGDELERGFLGALAKIATYEVSDTLLTLNTADGPVARFRPR